MNYAALTQALQDYCQTDEPTFVTHIPQFVRSAEQKILRAVRLPVTRNVDATVSISSGNTSVDISALDPALLLPLSMKIVSGGVDYPLLIKDPSFMTEAWPDATDTAMPRFYALEDSDTILVGPTPDAAYTATLRYLGFPESIVTASTSWLGNNAESALLYGSLVEAEMFRKGETDLYEWYKNKFEEELVLLADEQKNASQDEYYGTTRA